MERFLPPTGEERDESVVLAHVSADVVEYHVIAAQRDDAWLNEEQPEPVIRRRDAFKIFAPRAVFFVY
jgi:hypothetical protein